MALRRKTYSYLLDDFNRIRPYHYGTNVGKLCKTESLQNLNVKLLILMIIEMKIRHNSNLRYIPDHLHIIIIIIIIIIIAGSG